MSQIQVNYGALEQLSGDIDGRAKAIEGQLEELGNQIRQLEGIWEGSGNEAFQAQKAQWFTSAEDMKQVLAKIAVAVKTARDNYQATDNRAAGMLGG